jgi:adenine-specific DNA-methyltransferase
VAKPRCEAAVTGVTPQGDPVEGEYNDDTPIADGLAENVAFFELTYLDRNDVARGGAFDEIAPLLWLAAGATGEVAAATGAPFVIPEGSRYAVLFDVAAWRDFADLIDSRPQITHVFVVTDSLAQFQQVAAELPPGLRVSMLWDDYLRHFDESTGG